MQYHLQPVTRYHSTLDQYNAACKMFERANNEPSRASLKRRGLQDELRHTETRTYAYTRFTNLYKQMRAGLLDAYVIVDDTYSGLGVAVRSHSATLKKMRLPVSNFMTPKPIARTVEAVGCRVVAWTSEDPSSGMPGLGYAYKALVDTNLDVPCWTIESKQSPLAVHEVLQQNGFEAHAEGRYRSSDGTELASWNIPPRCVLYQHVTSVQ